MAFQQVYTSYSTSLVQGRTGFSTVARCRDIPERLVSEIERISQYDIPSGTVFSHRIIDCGVRYHVLTRTKDCGVDYTNRNNYIAHHLIFSENEIATITVNPAEILSGYSQWLDSFEGEPRYLPEVDSSSFDKLHKFKLPAENWLAKFGDCAYAASLGSSASIFAGLEQGSALLRLYGESLHLLAHKNEDWSITFTTHIFPSEKSSDFCWYASSEEGRDYTVDFIRMKVDHLPVGRNAEYARSGLLTNAEKYNLKVERNIPSVRRFNVVQEETSYMPIFVGVALAVVIVLATVLYCFSDGENQPSQPNTASKQERLVDIKQEVEVEQAQSIRPKITLSNVISLAREKIDAGNFEEAITYWKSHPYASTHKQYEDELRADIKAKISSMLRYAENVSLNPDLSEAERSKAMQNLSIIEKSFAFADAKTKVRVSEKVSEIRRILSSEK